MEKKVPRYNPEPPSHELPNDPEEPGLKLCTLVDGCLVLPRDVRMEFMSDPIRSPEWRKVVQEFDRCFASVARGEPAAAAAVEPARADGQGACDFDWSKRFPEEPRAKDAWHEKYDTKVKGKCQWCPQLAAYLVDPGTTEGEQVKYMLFIEASEDYTVPADEGFMLYGTGTWLLDAKADTYIEENQNGYKGVLCRFTSDTHPVTFEDRPRDPCFPMMSTCQKHVCPC